MREVVKCGFKLQEIKVEIFFISSLSSNEGKKCYPIFWGKKEEKECKKWIKMCDGKSFTLKIRVQRKKNRRMWEKLNKLSK